MKMQNKAQQYITIMILLVIMIGLPMLVHAQPDPGDNPDAPIDGGLSLLVAAGVGYGVKKVREGRKKRN